MNDSDFWERRTGAMTRVAQNLNEMIADRDARIAELEAALVEWQISHESQVSIKKGQAQRIAELEAENRHLRAVEYETRSESTSEWVDG